jgi:UDP-N-acetylglucosamine 4,6-dehydratase
VRLPDRFIIEPGFDFWVESRNRTEGAVPVSEEFYYDSECNDEWLDGETFLKLIEASRV